MRLALASSFFGEPTSFTLATEQVRAWGLDGLVLDVPGPVPAGSRDDAHGVTFPAIFDRGRVRLGQGAGERWPEAVETTFLVGGRLRAERVVAEGASDVPEDRSRREEAVEDAARSLHAPLRRGVPLAVRHGAKAEDLLLAEEVEWLLDAQPRLGLVLDPARALALHRAEAGPAPAVWAERFGGRTVLVACHGLGATQTGGRHPAEDGLDWRLVQEMVPGRTPWVLDLAFDLEDGDLVDAIRYLADALGS